MTYNLSIFISHSWQYSVHYEKLRGWIFDEQWTYGGVNLNFKNTSVPMDNPIHYAPNAQTLQNVIYALILQSNIVIVPTGMYSTYSEWIEKELKGAEKHDKPILGVNPWGQQRASGIVQRRATKIVGWNRQSVVKGIVDLCRR